MYKLEEFLRTKEWISLKKLLEKKIGLSSCWIMTHEENIIFKEEKDRQYCRIIKSTNVGGTYCKNSIILAHKKAISTGMPYVYSCHAKFLGFCIPITLNGRIYGSIGSCQFKDDKKSSADYEEVAKRLQIDTKTFLSSINNTAFKTSLGELELDVELIFDLTKTSIELNEVKEELVTKDKDVDAIAEFYKLFEESRSLMFTLEPDKLYKLIVSLTAKTLNAEICSLMLVDKATGEITIKGAIGLDEEHIKKTKLSINKGIVGYVVKTGQPLLVKDITKDGRFTKSTSAGKYYTKSLISAPLKINNDVLGVINVNNEATRRPFTERDLNLLNIICGHAACAIKNIKDTHKEERVEIKEEIEIMKKEKEGLTKEKEDLIKEKKNLEESIESTDKEILEREKEIKSKEEILTKAKDLSSEEIERLKKEKEELEKQMHELLKEKEELLVQVKDKEVLIKEKEELEREREELLKEKEELEAQTEELGILYTISREIPLMTSGGEILSFILEKIQPFFNYHAASFLLLDNDRVIGEIKQTCYLNEVCIEWIKNTVENKWKEFNHDKREYKKPSFMIKNLPNVGIFWIGSDTFNSYLVSKLNYKGENIGLLCVVSFNKDAFTPLQRRVLTIISNQAVVNLEKVRLFTKIKELAERDELTKVYNYRFFEDFLEKEFNYAKTYNKNISLIMLDFDHLKHFNDNYGHQEGNRLIKTVCDLIKESLGDIGCLTRYGGDEFAIILTETDINVTYDIAEKIRSNIASHKLLVNKKQEQLSASLGIATYPTEGIDTKNDLLAKADKALYEAKNLGRNKVCIYNP